MPRKKESLTLSIPPGTRDQLDRLADQLNYHWGTKPSPSALITAIARGDLALGPKMSLNSEQTKALVVAVKALVDEGKINEAKSVITLLLSHGDLEAPLRQSLLQQVSQPMEAWRIQVDKFIDEHQSFHLIYGRPNGNMHEFTVRHAKIEPYEKRLYLQIWCEETADSTDFPGIEHNRTLRLDRIQNIFPIDGHWRGNFDYISVEFHLLKGLIYAYEPRKEDVADETFDDHRRIVRKVANTFWFIREVRRYGPDCLIISPNNVRKQFKKDLELTLQHYESQD
ncbi:helix-turn-helix transcriptional regulator [Leptothoe spongobia]|uniref:WYL domain-containing protein n=1 Tax=Leptothoe spongobia TAU-MAC 1115 TaxID=1967444 RepID=A0A947DE15_9CYAN|nr:WYL domain-containing protein [Leptothoe spongobia]MBT9314853.1 WYL domain-containing protein [Leptothoe spongobia TAU-MAC 1115]